MRNWLPQNLWWLLLLGAAGFLVISAYYNISNCGLSALFVRCVRVAQ